MKTTIEYCEKEYTAVSEMDEGQAFIEGRLFFKTNLKPTEELLKISHLDKEDDVVVCYDAEEHKLVLFEAQEEHEVVSVAIKVYS